ncbi:gliding motility-associated C-terminal domain-containing protein [Flavobacterium lindanitolerans]|uniref:T9SS type B sorting domain-containing protein n=1 Tax=Flavobacterium lindanitolerans TaxID=428988 RepID=UPI0027B94A49|nr:gliding motility-associated C-terminal domain-containing protein [Flavobacterium lindanitolerans]
MKIYNQRKKLCLLYCFLFGLCFAGFGYAQITISTPSIAFTQACASANFNTYNFSFSFFPVQNLGASNQFIVELSDRNGSFANPVIVKTLTNTTSPVTSNFNLPTNTYGEGYRIRVRSTSPVKVSPNSNAFAAYYAAHNQAFSINGNNSTVTLCGNESFLLQIDNDGTSASPLYYPSLNYKWYKNFIEIPGERGASLTVTQPGSYYVIVDYGTCVMNSYSNIVQVQVQSPISPVIQAENNSTAICPNDTRTLTSVLQNTGYTYAWYKNNNSIPGATGPTYQASEEGIYHLEITVSGCTFESDPIALEVIDFNLSLSTSSQIVLIPGETITVNTITDAQNPQFQWHKNTSPLPGATQAALNITQAGDYTVSVTEAQPCNITKESTVSVVYPSGFDVQVQTGTGYTSCTSTATTLSISRFDAITENNNINLLGNTYNYSYQWYKNDIAIPGATNISLPVNSPSENGNYLLKITIPDFGVVTSNTIAVNLALENNTITNNGPLCENGTVLLSSNITNTAYTYQWFKNDIAIAGAVSSTHTASEEGNYYLIATSGTCTKQSNTVALQIPTFTITTTSPAFDILIPGEQKTLSVSTDATAPQFAWFRNNDPIPGANQSSYVATQNGTYKVVVTQNQGCLIQKEKVFVLEYPSGFEVTITPTTSYTACDNGPVTLSITRFIANTSQGVIDLTNRNNSAYTYQWFKNTSTITGATGTSHSINSATENGSYTVSVTLPDFAPVVSNAVDIKLSPENTTISSSGALCEGSSVTLSSSITNSAYTYQWFKNDLSIPGANTDSHTADSEGNYYLIISQSGCTRQSNTITLTIGQISIASTSPATDILLPGETKTFTVTTDAVAPQFAWFRNNDPIPGANQSSYTATQNGTYKVVVTQTQGCNATAEKVFVLEYPTGFEVTIAPTSSYTACDNGPVALSITRFIANTSQGTIDLTNRNNSAYTYQWFKNTSIVAGATATSHTINSATENGSYTVSVTLPDFAPVVSNAVDIKLSPENNTISSSGALCEGSSVTLSSSVANSAYTYQWFKNDQPIPGATTYNHTADSEGNYYLIISQSGCTRQSNTITLTIGQISIASTSPATDILLPGETKTFTVTTDATAPQFAWFRNNDPIPGANQSSYTATQNGTYKVVVTQTQGCNATAEKIFVLEYPTGFESIISANSDYQQCSSTSITLSLASLIATTPSGTISVTNTSGYTFQWFKNGDPVVGAIASSLTLNTPSENGIYKLQITLPDFAPVFSNDITVNLFSGQPLAITAVGQLCPENPQVIIQSNFSNSSYTYTWFRNGDVIGTGNNPDFSATEIGNYKLSVNTGSCTFESNTIEIRESDFNLTPNSPLDDTIIPGQVKTLSVTTDALQPAIDWFRYDIQISNSSSSSFAVNRDGDYKAVVKQTQGCEIIKETAFNLRYPNEMNIAIATNSEFQQCGSTTATLKIASFNAVVPSGSISILNNTYNYQYQWFRNGEPVAGATGMTLTLNNHNDTGSYTLQVTIPDYAVIVSNAITVNLSFANEVVISTNDILCSSETTVTIRSNINSPEYTYKWYKQGNGTVIGTENSLTVNSAGNYFLVVSYLDCTITSNTLEIVPFDMSQITVDSPRDITLILGTSITLTASGAHTYEWYFNDQIVSNGPSVTIEEPGTYKLIAKVGECQVTKEFVVTGMENNMMAIPNVVTPNADGINDTWNLPTKYVNNENVEVVIYGPDGAIVFRSTRYLNNWPESSFTYSLKNPVYYYTIMEGNKITERGSITIVK